MATVKENLTYVSRRIKRTCSVTVIRAAKAIAVLFALALLLEVFVFNFNYFASRNYNPICLNDKLTLQEVEQTDTRVGAEKTYRITSVNNVIEFSDLNTEVKNIYLKLDAGQSAQLVDVKIQFTDAAHKTYFDSTEYSVGVPTVSVSTVPGDSQYINLSASGRIENLRIEVLDEEASFPIYLNGIYLNMPRPFSFNMTRMLAVFFVMLLLFAFRPKSSIYRIRLVDNPRSSKIAIAFATAVQIVLLTSYLLFGSNLVGVATSSYNYGSWDGQSLINSFEVGGDNAQQYAELAKAMAHGQLYLEEDPPDWLKAMDDPYDKGARDELQKQTGEKYLFDVAYHDGHYYVYFGVVPVLLFYLPYYLATGANFPSAIGVLIALIAFILGCTALLDRFARYHFKRVSLGLFLLLQIPLVFCSGILYLAKFPTFYSLPIACAMAFSVWGLYLWMRGRSSERPIGFYLAGSLCMALVVGCRPQFILFSVLAFPLFWRKYITEKRLFTKRGALEFACLIAPYFIVAAGIMWYNKARFGSLTDFGANYNLTMNDMTKRGMNVGRIAPALFAYLIQTPSTTGVFPFIQPVPFETTYMGQTIREVTFGGVFACLPILWILPFAPSILRIRTRQKKTRTVMGVVTVLIASGILVAVLDAEMAGILQRYYADFSFMFLMAMMLLVFIVNESLSQDSVMYRVLSRVMLAAVGISVLYCVLTCFVSETGYYSTVYDWAYVNIIKAVQFWT